MRVTFAGNIRNIVTQIETAEKNIKQAKIDGFSQIANEAFKQAASKYVVPGNYAVPSSTGKSLKYTTPPGANINKKTTVFYNKKTKFRKVTEVAMFIKGKFVSRSGHYEKTLTALANAFYKEGSFLVEGVRVEIKENSIRIFVDDKSEVFILETRKQLGKTAIAPITKSFRSVVNLWSKVQVKLGSK